MDCCYVIRVVVLHFFLLIVEKGSHTIYYKSVFPSRILLECQLILSDRPNHDIDHGRSECLQHGIPHVPLNESLIIC